MATGLEEETPCDRALLRLRPESPLSSPRSIDRREDLRHPRAPLACFRCYPRIWTTHAASWTPGVRHGSPPALRVADGGSSTPRGPIDIDVGRASPTLGAAETRRWHDTGPDRPGTRPGRPRGASRLHGRKQVVAGRATRNHLRQGGITEPDPAGCGKVSDIGTGTRPGVELGPRGRDRRRSSG